MFALRHSERTNGSRAWRDRTKNRPVVLSDVVRWLNNPSRRGWKHAVSRHNVSSILHG
jgi:hypothetical protein